MKLFISTADESDDVQKLTRPANIWQLQAIQRWMGVADAYSSSFSCALYRNFISSLLLTCNFQAAAEVRKHSQLSTPHHMVGSSLYEDFISKWKEFCERSHHDRVMASNWSSIESLEKYYNKTDDSPIHIVLMCKCILSRGGLFLIKPFVFCW